MVQRWYDKNHITVTFVTLGSFSNNHVLTFNFQKKR